MLIKTVIKIKITKRSHTQFVGDSKNNIMVFHDISCNLATSNGVFRCICSSLISIRSLDVAASDAEFRDEIGKLCARIIDFTTGSRLAHLEEKAGCQWSCWRSTWTLQTFFWMAKPLQLCIDHATMSLMVPEGEQAHLKSIPIVPQDDWGNALCPGDASRSPDVSCYSSRSAYHQCQVMPIPEEDETFQDSETAYRTTRECAGADEMTLCRHINQSSG